MTDGNFASTMDDCLTTDDRVNMDDRPNQSSASDGKSGTFHMSERSCLEPGTEVPQCSESGSDLDPEYLSHIRAEVSRAGFTSPQQIYDTINNMSEEAASFSPSDYQMPSNTPIPNSSPSTQTSLRQMESFLSIPNLPSRATGRRVELTLQEKVDLLHHSEGKSQRALAEIFEIGRTQVSLILKRKQEIIDMYTKGGHLERKRLRINSEKNDVNNMTHAWFLDQCKEGVTVTSPGLQEKAKEFANQLGRTDFKASNGWLQGFCKRNNIGFNFKQGLYVKETSQDSNWPSQVVRGPDSWTEAGNSPGFFDEGEKTDVSQSNVSETKDNENAKGESVQDSDPITVNESQSSNSTQTTSTGKKFKRCELNLLEKVELLKLSSEGKSERMLSKMFGIGRSQVYSTLRRKAEILEAYENTDNIARKRLNSRGDTDDVNQLTWHWFKEISKMDSVVICGPMIQAKAMEFANQLGREDFKASNGWLNTFKKRHHIKFKTDQGFVYDPPENIPLDVFFPSAQEEPEVKIKKVKEVTGCKRVDLNLKQRVEVIQQSEGKTHRELSAMFGVGKSQIRSILKRKDEILDMFGNSCNGDMKRLNKKAGTDDVNRLTLEWFREVSLDANAQITGVMVQEKAREFALQSGRDDFKASNGWLISFRKRNSIVVNDQKYLVISDEREIQTWKDSLSAYMESYDPVDIFCVSEVSLFYTCMPEEVLAAAKHQIQKKTKSKCVSVVLCSNMLGEFQIPVVIGNKTQDNVSMSISEDLPVNWKWSSDTWAKLDFFTDWVVSLDQKMREESRKVVLFLDRALPVDTEIILENVNLVCPPTYSTSFQPLSHGVVQAFRKTYLKLMMSAVLEQTQNASSSIGNVLNHTTPSDVCSWIQQAVCSVESAVVTRAFFDCGFNTATVQVDIGRAYDETETDAEYESLVQRVIKILIKKPLGYYMGMSTEPSSLNFSTFFSTSNETEAVPNNPCTSINESPTHSDDDTRDFEGGSGEEKVDEKLKEEELEDDQSDNDSLDSRSSLDRSLYTSIRRATFKQTNHQESLAPSKSVDQVQIKTEDVSDQSMDCCESDSEIRVLKSREDALEAAKSLRQYCIDNNLNVLDSIDSVISAL